MMKVFIIAEAGVNHNGDVGLAKKMIEVAKKCGVDAIKFQTFKAKNLVTKTAVKADYQKTNTNISGSQYEMIKKYELNTAVHKELIDHCKQHNILFLSTPFDLGSVDLLNNLGLDIFKVPSGDITNLPYLRKIGSLGKKVILSTGMSTLKEIETALTVLTGAGTLRENITVLHCNTEYPTPIEDVNLKAMITIKEQLNVKVGYSDHTLGVEIPFAAVAIGAGVIEKHFTLDKCMDGPDHKASLDPSELELMVVGIRKIEAALGDGVKNPSRSETKNIIAARKSIVAIKNIKKGEVLTEDNIGVKRPGSGLNPMNWDKVLGTKANRDYREDELIEL